MTAKVTRQSKTPGLCFHKKVGQFYVRLNGRTVYLGTDPAIARRRHHQEVAEWMLRGCVAAPPPPEELTLTELAALFLADRAIRYARTPGNLKRAATAIGYLVSLYPDMNVADLHCAHLEAARDVVINPHGNRRGGTYTYGNSVCREIVAMVRWGVARRYVHPNTLVTVKALEPLRRGFTTAREPVPRRLVDEWEVEAVTRHMTPTTAAAVWILFWTGCRPSELMNLRVGDIHRETSPWFATLHNHKTARHGVVRTLFFGPKSQIHLAPRLLKPADSYIFTPLESQEDMRRRRHEARTTPMNEGNRPGTNIKDNPAITPNETFDHCAVNRALARGLSACNRERKSAGLEPLQHFSLYCLRHSAANRIAQESGIAAAQALLGHTTLTTTAAYYLKPDQKAASAAMAQLG